MNNPNLKKINLLHLEILLLSTDNQQVHKELYTTQYITQKYDETDMNKT